MRISLLVLCALVYLGCQAPPDTEGVPEPPIAEGVDIEQPVDVKFPPKWLDEIGFKVAWRMDFHAELANFFYIFQKNRRHSLYVETKDHRLYKMDPKTGEVLWVVLLDEFISQPPYLYTYERIRTIEEEEAELNRYEISQMELIIKKIREIGKLGPELYLLTGNTLVCIDDNYGRMLWRKELPFGASSPPFASFSYVYVADWRKRLFAIRKGDRTIDWDFVADGDITGGGLSSDPNLFFSDESGKTYCINAATGREIWRAEALDRITSAPYYYHSRLFVGSWDGSVYALRDNDGTTLWRFDCEYPVVEQPIAIDDYKRRVNTVYAVTSKTVMKTFYAIDRRKGKKRWHLRNGMKLLLQGRQNTYILDTRRRICAVDTIKGVVRWQRPFKMVDFWVTNPTDRRAIKKEYGFYHIYCAFRNGLVYALEEREMY